jgi:hypothetical protein
VVSSLQVSDYKFSHACCIPHPFHSPQSSSLLLRWLCSPMQTFASLMDFSQSSLQSIWLFRGHVLGFLTVDFFRGGVVSPTPNPEPGGPSLHNYIPWKLGGPVIPPRHRVPILVAFYDMHGLQWDYSFPRSPHGGLLNLVALIFGEQCKIWNSSHKKYQCYTAEILLLVCLLRLLQCYIKYCVI